MPTRDELVASIVARLGDYRSGEIKPIDKARVYGWISQFEEPDRETILSETDLVLSKTYVSRDTASKFLANLASNDGITGGNPKEFWSKCGFLDIQPRGDSQREMLKLFAEVLGKKFGIEIEPTKRGRAVYVYLDDVCCSGDRIKEDLQTWVQAEDINNATINVILIGVHRLANFDVERELNPLITKKKCKLSINAAGWFENRLFQAASSEVFWPTSVPSDKYVELWVKGLKNNPKFKLRPAGGTQALFSSAETRNRVEQAYLKKGAYIWSLSENPKPSMRPLGFNRWQTPGFGATIVTYRNCPNNAPLPLWWGNDSSDGPLAWIPLLPRRINS